jgi:methylglutaconyl-CoA hydratase
LSELLLIDRQHPQVAVLTLNRPERRNALSIALMQQLVDQIEQLDTGGRTRVVILRGAGSVFCAGLDLAEAQDPDLVQQSAECVERTLHALRFSSLVTIAAVHGGAYAGGAGVAAACDIAVGSTDCRIAFPEARRGLLPALICDVLRTKLREGDLTELFLVGEPIDAGRAYMLGLLQRLVEPDQLLGEALRLAEGILAGGPQTIRDTKHLLHAAYGHVQLNQSDVQTTTSSAGSHSIDEHLRARFSEEASEGLRAFLEKRPPKWMASQ